MSVQLLIVLQMAILPQTTSPHIVLNWCSLCFLIIKLISCSMCFLLYMPPYVVFASQLHGSVLLFFCFLGNVIVSNN